MRPGIRELAQCIAERATSPGMPCGYLAPLTALERLLAFALVGLVQRAELDPLIGGEHPPHAGAASACASLVELGARRLDARTCSITALSSPRFDQPFELRFGRVERLLLRAQRRAACSGRSLRAGGSARPSAPARACSGRLPPLEALAPQPEPSQQARGARRARDSAEPRSCSKHQWHGYTRSTTPAQTAFTAYDTRTYGFGRSSSGRVDPWRQP